MQENYPSIQHAQQFDDVFVDTRPSEICLRVSPTEDFQLFIPENVTEQKLVNRRLPGVNATPCDLPQITPISSQAKRASLDTHPYLTNLSLFNGEQSPP